MSLAKFIKIYEKLSDSDTIFSNKSCQSVFNIILSVELDLSVDEGPSECSGNLSTGVAS
jgi:hypothetical protein